MENQKVPVTFFLLVGGVFVILYFVIMALMGSGHHANSEEMNSTIDSRTAPVAQVAVADPNAPAEKPATTAASGGAVDGKAVYDKVCGICHQAGVAGSPKTGDAAAWASRVEKGVDTLYEHAINGFMGAGMMPARGGNADLSDDEVKAAVDYILDNSK